MICKICGNDINKAFGIHINKHRWNLKKYFEQYKEQYEEYVSLLPKHAWNKGLTKETNKSVKKCADAIKEYSTRQESRKKQSDYMKERYKKGDILDEETRKKVAKAGSDGWVKKIKESTPEEKNKLLEKFIEAGIRGRKTVSENKKIRTPETCKKYYPFALGEPRYHNCDYCKNEMIIWFGGRPRPKKRFCSYICHASYRKEHPYYHFENCGKYYYSQKMNTEFYLRSNYEIWVADIFEKEDLVENYISCPFKIPYIHNENTRMYFPDFIVNKKYLIEVKSNYVFELNKDQEISKIIYAEEYASKNNYQFLYWQFTQNNMTAEKIKKDIKIINFIEKLRNDTR